MFQRQLIFWCSAVKADELLLPAAEEAMVWREAYTSCSIGGKSRLKFLPSTSAVTGYKLLHFQATTSSSCHRVIRFCTERGQSRWRPVRLSPRDQSNGLCENKLRTSCSQTWCWSPIWKSDHVGDRWSSIFSCYSGIAHLFEDATFYVWSSVMVSGSYIPPLMSRRARF